MRVVTLMHLSTEHEKSWKPSSLMATWSTEAVWPLSIASGFGLRVYGFHKEMVRSSPHEASCLAAFDQVNE